MFGDDRWLLFVHVVRRVGHAEDLRLVAVELVGPAGELGRGDHLVVFAAQHVPGKPLPLFKGPMGAGSGVLFRPGATKLLCGKPVDSSGQCGGACAGRLGSEWSEAADKMCTWPPKEFGGQLQRLTAFQTKWKNLFYNEIIVDAKAWRQNLPDCVEAIFGNRVHHQNFLDAYGLTEETHPFLSLDLDDWGSPFRAGESQGTECVQHNKCVGTVGG